MNIPKITQYISMIAAPTVLLIKHDKMKKFVPVALFSSLYANVWCYIAEYFHLWKFKHKVFGKVKDISVPANMFVVPVASMFWLRFCPKDMMGKIDWSFGWSVIMTALEFMIGKRYRLIRYRKEYKWYHSFLLWFFSWFIWLGFYEWIHEEEEASQA